MFEDFILFTSYETLRICCPVLFDPLKNNLCMSGFVCMYTYASCACLVPAKAKRGHWISRDWSYRQLSAIVLVLETKLRSCARKEHVPLTVVASFFS